MLLRRLLLNLSNGIQDIARQLVEKPFCALAEREQMLSKPEEHISRDSVPL